MCHLHNYLHILVFLSVPLLQLECNLQQIRWSPKIREHDLIFWFRWVLLPLLQASFCWYAEHIRGWLMWKFKSHLWINYMYLSVFYQKATGGTSQTHLLKIVVFPRCLTGWHPLGRSGWPNSWSLRACCPESESAKVPISCTFVFESAAKSELVSVNLVAAEVLAEYYCAI